MPEAITKYALNSTLGTDRFRPLDEIITSLYLFEVGAIESRIAYFMQNAFDVPDSGIPLKSSSILFNYGGKINICYSIYKSGIVHANVYKNDKPYESFWHTGLENNVETQITLEVEIKPGDVLRVDFESIDMTPGSYVANVEARGYLRRSDSIIISQHENTPRE